MLVFGVVVYVLCMLLTHRKKEFGIECNLKKVINKIPY